MILYEVTINGEQSTRAGASDQTSMSLRLTSADVFPEPNLSVSAFKVKNEKLEKHYQWDFPSIRIGDEVMIRVLDDGEPDKPSLIGGSTPKHTPDEKALMKHEIAKLKRSNIELDERLKRASAPDDNEQDTMYCSFCGRSQFEVERLVAGPAVFICNVCVDSCVEIQKDKS